MLIESDPKSAELIRPILRGRDIKRYCYDFAKLWVIYIPYGFTNQNRKGQNPEERFKTTYPSIYYHLVNVQNELSKTRNAKSKGLYKRDDQGEYWWELRSCKYLDDFNKQKIIYPETTQGAYFVIDSNHYVIDKTCFMIITENPEFLCAILSSSLYECAYKRIYSSVELGTSAYQYNKHALIKLPIIPYNKVNPKIISNIKLIFQEREFTNGNITKLNEIIYQLYNLSNTEIKYVESVIN